MSNQELSESIVYLSTPHMYAEQMSAGQWHSYDFIKFISHKITWPVLNGGGRFIINIPPQHGKSLFISKWVPIWYLVNRPRGRIILASYEANFAAYWGRQVRDEILHNNKIPISIRSDVSAASSWETDEGGMMITAGVGGPITGKSGDLIIVDDPVKNWDEAKSRVYQDRNYDWFNSVLYTRKQPKTTIIIVMTRWHENDLAGRLLQEHTDQWELIKLPAIAEEEDALGRNPGEALCPERFDEKELEKTKRAVGPLFWPGMYQQRPSALEGGIIKRAWIQFYEHEIILPEVLIQSWDLSFKETSDGSYVVGQVWAKKDSNFYLLYQVRERVGFVETAKSIKMVASLYPKARAIYIENKANGPAIIDMLRKEIAGIIAVEAKESKEARFSAISTFFESGNVYIPTPKNNPWVLDYIDELVNFPNSSHDDQVDATSQGLLKLSEISRKVEFFTVESSIL